MKWVILTATLGVAWISAFAQGTLNFANLAAGLDAPVFRGLDNTPLSGSAWSADLFWAAGVVSNPNLLTELGQPAGFSTIPSQAGFFFGGPRTIPGAAGNSVITAQVRVWGNSLGATWEQAVQTQSLDLGESVLFQVTLGTPGNPSVMAGLKPFYLIGIPEPSARALLGLGFAGICFRRRPSIAA